MAGGCMGARKGAISMLSGFCRMTVSLVVIMFELTGAALSSIDLVLRFVCVCVRAVSMARKES